MKKALGLLSESSWQEVSAACLRATSEEKAVRKTPQWLDAALSSLLLFLFGLLMPLHAAGAELLAGFELANAAAGANVRSSCRGAIDPRMH